MTFFVTKAIETWEFPDSKRSSGEGTHHTYIKEGYFLFNFLNLDFFNLELRKLAPNLVRKVLSRTALIDRHTDLNAPSNPEPAWERGG